MRTRKVSLKTLEKNLWGLVKAFVFLRDDYTCQKCGKLLPLNQCQPAHVIPKSRSKYLRFEPVNVITFCYYDHIYWWHQNPLEATEWFKSEFPSRYEFIMENKNNIAKFKRSDYEERIKTIQELISHAKPETDRTTS